MELQKFLLKNGIEGLNILSRPPYSLSIKRDEKYPSLVLLKYAVNSDASLSINNEARGVIFDTTNWNVVARGFDRFFNYTEPNAATINFSTAKVQEKVDGSIIKLYNYNNKWIISSSSMIDARKEIEGRNFGDLFLYAAYRQNLNFNRLNPNNTYIFELVSPYTQVVVYYPKTEIYHIGTRNNITGLETEEDIGIQKPHTYHFSSMEEIEKKLPKMSKNEEGYVVVDNNYHRVKMKSFEWLKMHSLVGNGDLTLKKIISLILNKEDFTEYISYFPKNVEKINMVKDKINTINNNITTIITNIRNNVFFLNNDRRMLSEYIKTHYNNTDKTIAFLAIKKDNIVEDIWDTNDAVYIANFYKKFIL